MNKRYTVPLIAAAGMLGVTAVSSVVVAADQAKAETETQGKESRSAINNAWLYGKRETGLQFDEHLNVESKQGVVTLSGVVKPNGEKDLAIKLASNTSGANSVTHRLVIGPNQEAGPLTCG